MSLKYLKLYLGIIISPSKTFEEIIKGKYIIPGILIWLIFGVSYLFAVSFVLQQSFNNKVINIKSALLLIPDVLLQLKTIFTLLGFYIGTLIQNFIAVVSFKLKSSYWKLLICNLFINVIGILESSFMAILVFKNPSLISYLNLIFFPWSFLLNIISIKTVYNTSFKTALEIFFIFAIIVTFLILITFIVF